MLDLLLASGVRPAIADRLVANLGSVAAIASATTAELRAAGVPPRTADKLVAAFTFGQRAITSAGPRPESLARPEDAFRLLREPIGTLPVEVFMVISIDVRNGFLGMSEVARGTVCGVEVHPREVFRPAIRLSAAGIIIAHNHPSGDPTPSPEDIQLTKRIRECGSMVGIPVIDHVVVAAHSFRSISEWMGNEF